MKTFQRGDTIVPFHDGEKVETLIAVADAIDSKPAPKIPHVYGRDRKCERCGEHQLDIYEKRIGCKKLREEELLDALAEIGRLTKWVGWMEHEADQSFHGRVAAANMRRIQEIVKEVTGWEFGEYT